MGSWRLVISDYTDLLLIVTEYFQHYQPISEISND